MSANEKDYAYFKEILSKKKLKITPQRLNILKLVKYFGHIDIDALYSEVSKDFPSISLATIYKNIALMVENGILNEVKIPQGKTKYELAIKTHAHFICTNCSYIEDIEIDNTCLLKSLENYTVNSANIQIFGLCKSCEQLKKRQAH